MATSPSPLAAAAAAIGDRWSLLVVEALLPGPRRFNELAKDLVGIAPTVLSQRLKHLEREGVVVARQYSERPPRFAYLLTAAGQELAGALRLLAAWGAAHAPDSPHDADLPRHTLCGTALEARWFCPTCSVEVRDPLADELHYA
jgi:DNA-binding HxlR family transcriptional regulator